MMDDENDDGLGPIREMVAGGTDMAAVIEALQSYGMTITQSMKFLVKECGMDLAEAKEVVSDSPVWREVVKASDPLKDEILGGGGGIDHIDD